MVLTTEQEQQVAGFYNRLAPDYDRMTGFAKRFVHEKPFFRMLVEKFGIRSALDAGAGTGFHSLLLSQLGVDVTAVDVSAEMLQALDANAREKGLHVRALESSFEDLQAHLTEPFDSVFCLGNALAHILSPDALRLVLANFASLLKSDGVLFLQTVNFERILKSRDRIQNIREAGNVMTVRFYDYEDEFIRFNVLKIEKADGGMSHSLNSVLLRPILREELLQMLEEAGFIDIKTYGGITMEEFDTCLSRDLVVLARRK